MNEETKTLKAKDHTLIIISAPSGAGKTTLCKQLLADFPTVDLSISCTTRKPRGKEQNGVDYDFISVEEFKQGIEKGRFVEWALVHDNYYGTSKDRIERSFNNGHSVLLDIDVQGAEQLRKSFKETCLSIFISPPSLQELEARLRIRNTDKEETIQKRLKNAKIEMAQSHLFDHVIVNDSLDRAYGELKSILESKLKLKAKAVKV